MAKEKQNTDTNSEKLAILEAEVERLTAENESLRRQLDAARESEGSVTFKAPRGKEKNQPRVDTVIEYGGTFYRITRPAFFALGRRILATDLLTDETLTGQLMAEYPQLFAPADDKPADA